MLKLAGLCLLISLSIVQAGFRCSLGNWACSAGCAALGQTSGICDEDWKCWCSEREISLDDIKALLPSRCDLGESFCEGTCNSIGRKTGKCTTERGGKDCECSDEYLSPTEFALCAAASTCRIHCQTNGQGSGQCDGWVCNCESKIAANATKEDNTAKINFESIESK